MTDSKKVIGRRIREMREKQGLLQEQLARMLGMQRTNVANYEAGRSSPFPETLAKIAKILNTTTDYLVGNTDDPYPPGSGITA